MCFAAFADVSDRRRTVFARTHTEPEQFKSFLIRCGGKVSPRLLFFGGAAVDVAPLVRFNSNSLFFVRCAFCNFYWNL